MKFKYIAAITAASIISLGIAGTSVNVNAIPVQEQILVRGLTLVPQTPVPQTPVPQIPVPQPLIQRLQCIPNRPVVWLLEVLILWHTLRREKQ
ncbi:MAG: hypothetical protein AAFR77_09655 [Cyanobacteria bacterium J06631_2]